jgi:hypothetical protein
MSAPFDIDGPMTFDRAQAWFRASPDKSSADAYEDTAKEYFDDGMIGVDTYNAAIDEIRLWQASDADDPTL